jgi:hypothetical protein
VLAALIGDGEGSFEVMSDLRIARDGDELLVSATTTHFTPHVVLRGDGVIKVASTTTLIGERPDPVIQILDRVSRDKAEGTRVVGVEIVGPGGDDPTCDMPGSMTMSYRIDISIDTANLWGGVRTIAGDFPQGVRAEGSFITVCSQDEFGPSPGQSVEVRVRVDHFGSGETIVPRSATGNGLSGIVTDPFPAESVDLAPFSQLAASFDPQCDGPSPEDAFPFGFAASQTVDGLGVSPIDSYGCWNLWAARPGSFPDVSQVRDVRAMGQRFIAENLVLLTDEEGRPATLDIGPGEGPIAGGPHRLSQGCVPPAEDCWNGFVFP